MTKKRESLGEYVRRVREGKKLSLMEVVRRSRNTISKGYISQIENFYIKDPSPTMLRALARGLGISESELYEIAQGGTDADKDAGLKTRFITIAGRIGQLPDKEKKEALIIAKGLEIFLDVVAVPEKHTKKENKAVSDNVVERIKKFKYDETAKGRHRTAQVLADDLGMKIEDVLLVTLHDEIPAGMSLETANYIREVNGLEPFDNSDNEKSMLG